ncbi:MAG: tetratricopeptide repeat protein [Bradymonadia bacterium]
MATLLNATARRTGVLSMALAFFAGTAQSGPEDDVRKDLSQITGILSGLEQQYLAPELLERNYQITSRLSEGQLYYLSGDYVRAAMILLDLVEDPRVRTHPAWRDALVYLADALYQIRNYNAASRFYEMLITAGTAEQQQKGVGRLLEIALISEDDEAARQLLERADNLLKAEPDPVLLYAVGKYHHQRGELDKAQSYFDRVPDSHSDAPRARYYQAVLLVEAGRLEEARAAFEAVATRVEKAGQAGRGAPTRQAREIRDLSLLAIARVNYELGLFAEAVEAYTRVPRDSSYFEDALYESVWISVKQNRYEEALRRLEILLISQPDVLERPDTRLLQGKLLMMLERYTDASLAFQEVLFEFGPIQAQMRSLAESQRGRLERYFHDLIGEELADFELSSILPPGAEAFAGSEVEADTALELVGELGAEKRSIDEARRIIERLETALNADNRVEIFPKLHEGWLKAAEILSWTVKLRLKLNETAERKLSNPNDSQYTRLKAERQKWAKAFSEVPTSAVQIQARDARIDDEIAAVDAEAFKVGIQIRGLEAQLVAMERYVAESRDDEQLVRKRQELLGRISIELNEMKTLKDELEKLKAKISDDRLQIGTNDEATVYDERIRKRLVEALDREAAWLARNGAPISGEITRQLSESERRARAFLSQAGALVDDKVADLKRQLVRERARVEQYDGELLAYQGETESLSGRIAARSFNMVLERVDSVVLEADVGLIDVAWKQKKDQSDRITRQLERQNSELQALDRDFRDELSD